MDHKHYLELGTEDNDGLENNQTLQVVMHQLRQTVLIFPGPCDQTCCIIVNMLQLA